MNPVFGGLPPNAAAIIAAELASLAADAQTLQGRLATGDVVAAVVLPSNGLTDLLQIGGLRVAAELPPNLLPGETIAVEVTGFTGDRINLHILPNATLIPGPPGSVPPAPAGATPGAPRTPPAAAPPPPARPSLDIARLAASGAGRLFARPPGNPLGVRAPNIIVPGQSASLEARLAAARAAQGRTAPPAMTAKSAQSAARSANSPALRPPIAPRETPLAGAPRETPVGGAPRAAAAAILTGPRGPAAFSEPAAFLRALGLPATESNLGAARAALDAPARLPTVLANLGSVLAETRDPRGASLSTIAGFIARLEPTSPVLAAQIAAFVDQVTIGREPKLAQLLAAHAAAVPTTPAAAADDFAAPARPAAAAALVDSQAAERVVIRSAALDGDLKTQLLALADDATATDAGSGGATAKSAALTTAVGAALSAVTAVQLGAASALAANPDGLAFSLPLTLPTGFARAQVRIDRDAPQAGHGPLDGDNFHIAFVLDTQHLGTIAIDMQTVGRAVTLGIQTEGNSAQRVFGAALPTLAERLEMLRYRVAKADASVAPRGLAGPAPTAVSAAPTDSDRLIDFGA